VRAFELHSKLRSKDPITRRKIDFTSPDQILNTMKWVSQQLDLLPERSTNVDPIAACENPPGPKIATSTFELHTSVLQKTITKNSHSPSAASQKMVPAYLSDPKYPHNQQPKRKTPPTHRKTPMAPDPSPKKLINLGMGAAPAAQTQG